MRRALFISLIALCTGLHGCNSKTQTSKTTAGVGAAVASDINTADPIDVSVRAIIIKGGLEVYADGSWRAMGANEQAHGATKVRASGKGAVIALGDSGDMLWLRGGSTIALARARTGGVVLQVVAGQARMRSVALPAYIKNRQSTIELTGRDIIARKASSSADTALAFTNSEPDRAAWSLELDGETRPAGIGSIDIAPAAGGESAKLELRRVAIKVETAGDYAYTEVEHVFYNPTDEQLEGTFRFPLPEGAMPLGLAMEIQGRMMEGEIVEREKARKTYESIVDAMLDPALLEWQQGNRFKLRVFPIEPQSPKRVVFRYAAPLSKAVGGWEYVYATAAPSMQAEIPHFQLSFNGKVVADRKGFVAGEDIVVPVAASAVPTATREIIDAAPDAADPFGALARTKGTYTAVRLAPDWSQLVGQDKPAKAEPRAVLAIVDTSRSALEAHALAMQTIELMLAELDSNDRFLVMAADIETRLHAESFVPAGAENVRAALDFLRAIELDGASDIGAAFERAGELVASAKAQGTAVDIVYVGDGTPTWGATEPSELRALIDKAIADAPVHAAVLGKGSSARLWRQLTGGRAGRVAMPRKLMDAKRFAFLVAHSGQTPRIEGLKVAGADAETIAFPNDETALYRGEELVVVMRTKAGTAPPAELTLTGRYRGKVFTQKAPIIAPTSTRLVSQRWATLQIAELQAQKADKSQIVPLSRDFGVMSKHTSLLVLESEEAYKEHGIERRRTMLAQNQPKVTGGDLESLGERQASLSPDHIQPGDPEIRIPAPADARSVVVIFPFGDTKLAEFDTDANAWITRFLIDKDTPDGKYTVLVKVVLADGRLQTYRLPYFVDTKAPTVTLEFKPRRRGGFIVTAKQIVTAAEMSLVGGGNAKSQKAATKAAIVNDTRRVELWLPSGEMLSLGRKRPGLFRRSWKLPQAPTEAVTLRVVVTDQALNQTTFAVKVQPDGTSEVLAEDEDMAPAMNDRADSNTTAEDLAR